MFQFSFEKMSAESLGVSLQPLGIWELLSLTYGRRNHHHIFSLPPFQYAPRHRRSHSRREAMSALTVEEDGSNREQAFTSV